MSSWPYVPPPIRCSCSRSSRWKRPISASHSMQPFDEVAAGDARALAVLELADAARGERPRVERPGELLGDRVERQEALVVARQLGGDGDADDRAHLGPALPAAVLDGQQPAADRLAVRRRARRPASARPASAAHSEAPARIHIVMWRDHHFDLLAGAGGNESAMGNLRILGVENCQPAWSFRRTVDFPQTKGGFQPSPRLLRAARRSRRPRGRVPWPR